MRGDVGAGRDTAPVPQAELGDGHHAVAARRAGGAARPPRAGEPRGVAGERQLWRREDNRSKPPPTQHQNLHQIPAPAPAQLWFGLYHTTPNLSLSVCAGTLQLTFVCMVSQDLEMFLPKSKSDDGYNILVRTGRQVQELHVVTALSRDELKKVLVAVTGQIAADLDA
jgi:hypothetical protein